jgi:hypothetical protein
MVDRSTDHRIWDAQALEARIPPVAGLTGALGLGGLLVLVLAGDVVAATFAWFLLGLFVN